MTLHTSGLLIAPHVCVQHGPHSSADLNFPLVSCRFAAYDFVYIALNLIFGV